MTSRRHRRVDGAIHVESPGNAAYLARSRGRLYPGCGWPAPTWYGGTCRQCAVDRGEQPDPHVRYAPPDGGRPPTPPAVRSLLSPAVYPAQRSAVPCIESGITAAPNSEKRRIHGGFRGFSAVRRGLLENWLAPSGAEGDDWRAM